MKRNSTKELCYFGENIAFGESDALENLIQLIVDDGVPDRAHRYNIFNPNWENHGCF